MNKDLKMDRRQIEVKLHKKIGIKATKEDVYDIRKLGKESELDKIFDIYVPKTLPNREAFKRRLKGLLKWWGDK